MGGDVMIGICRVVGGVNSKAYSTHNTLSDNLYTSCCSAAGGVAHHQHTHTLHLTKRNEGEGMDATNERSPRAIFWTWILLSWRRAHHNASLHPPPYLTCLTINIIITRFHMKAMIGPADNTTGGPHHTHIHTHIQHTHTQTHMHKHHIHHTHCI